MLSKSDHDRELRTEQEYVAALYARLDAERVWVSKALDAALSDNAKGPEARWLRDATVDTWADRRRRLRLSDTGLCFGRIDTDRDGPVHIGRIGLTDAHDESKALLTDWRAPIARPFYTATGANPEGIGRRRHFHTRGRRLVEFHDETFTDDRADDQQGSDAALLAAVNAARTDGMRDIVATIQATQDEVIRLGSTGLVVVEGGPGTGKTAVALHRVAYLLYTHQELARRAVLLVGPNPAFLDYVSGVLPALGESDVVFTTLGDLLPGVRTARRDVPGTARVKGGADMVAVLESAVLDRQELPGEPIEIPLDDVTVWLNDEVAGQARDTARAGRLVHNQARAVFDHHVIEALTVRAMALIGDGWLEPPRPDEIGEEVLDEFGEPLEDDEDYALAERLTANVRAELSGSSALADALEGLWPMLTPQRLLAELFTSPERLATATEGVLSDADRDVLRRSSGQAWTVSDVPLLDEAVDMLGSDGTDLPPFLSDDLAEAADPDDEDEPEDPEELDYAEGVLEILDTDEDPDSEVLRAVDLMAADALAERQEEQDLRGLAERAAADRNWTYGHVVVDEAQELSEMDWRALMRRCPTKSMTVVGDQAQRESAAGAGSWAAALDPHVPGRWAYRRLAVNYRTPADIMDVAAAVLAEVDPELTPPTSVRRTGVTPWARPAPVGGAGLAEAVAAAVVELAGQVGEGSVAVIAPPRAGVSRRWAAALSARVGRPVSVLTPYAAKGLEFDAVLLYEPGRLLDGSRSGAAELYVALTRATQRLGVLHSTPLPAALSGLVTADEPVAAASG